MNGGRARGVALAVIVVGAALMLFAGGREWFSARAVTEGLPALPIRISGRDIAPVVSAVGLLGLAGAAVTLFVGVVLRRVVAAVVLAGALVASWRCVAVLVRRDAETLTVALRQVEGATVGSLTVVDMSAWPWVAVVGGVLVAVGAVLVLATVGTWPQASGRYEADDASRTDPAGLPSPAGKPSATPTDEADAMWKALDRGEDPTAVDPPEDGDAAEATSQS